MKNTDQIDEEPLDSNKTKDIEKHIDRYRRERANLRRSFTVACNKFDECDTKDDTSGKELKTLFNKIIDKSERLFNIDSKINDITICSEDEFDTIESYRDRFIEIKTKFELFTQTEVESNSIISQSNKSVLKLPKFNLKEFDLMPRTWVAFWGQFSRIHEDQNLEEEDKFQYLISSLSKNTKAKDIVDSYPPSKENYSKVIQHLKSRFGRQDLLIEVYIRDLLSLVGNRNTTKLSTLYDKLGSYLRALESLGVTSNNYAAMLYPVVESCLPKDVLKAWDRFRLNKDCDSNSIENLKEKVLSELMIFLGNEVEGEEHRSLAEEGFDFKNKKQGSEEIKRRQQYQRENYLDTPSSSELTSSFEKNHSKSTCLFCESEHKSQDCAFAAGIPLKDRKLIIIRKNCCLVCLKYGHVANACYSKVRCEICQRRHFPIMCPQLDEEDHTHPNKDKHISSSFMEKSSNVIYLKTVMIQIRNKGQVKYVRALLDDGSHRSYIEKGLARELQLSPSSHEVVMQSLFGGIQTKEAVHGEYIVKLEGIRNKFSCEVLLLDQPVICANLPRVNDPDLINELECRGIKLSDFGPGEPPLQMLLGADVLGKVLTGKIEILKSGITAIETKFGWSVLGSYKKKSMANIVSLSLQNIDMPKLWELETLGITDPAVVKSNHLLEQDTLEHFNKTVIINKENRYEVSLPWLSGHQLFSSNYTIAEYRLHSMSKKLKKEGLFDTYNQILLQWEKDGIIELVEKETHSISSSCYYLPHRPVIKPSSETTKVRPVFDASSKRSGSVSLNECLCIGPSLSQQIFPLLIKFRLGTIGVTADIQQAFLQLSVNPTDRDVLRFLWWEDEKSNKLKVYRHCRVVFGVTSSPFLLNATIKYHLNSEKYLKANMHKTIEKLKEGFYVDNLVTSVDSMDELNQFMKEAKQIMSDGQFNLRCWAYSGCEKTEQMILGVKWNTELDTLSCVAPIQLKRTVTKRTLLSIVNSIYDPIGYMCPALLLPKLLLQDAWRNKLSWDEDLPFEHQNKYEKWVETLPFAERCLIPRKVFASTSTNASLHIFTDASKDAYACCAFIKCANKDDISVQLLAAKSRISPMQRLTIPRLELLAACIGARLSKTIRDSLLFDLPTYHWSDSMVVLSWITKHEEWNTFVGNRVKEIRSLTDIHSWKFIPGNINPADLPSRTCDWKELLNSQWWEGPSWLKTDKNNWPDVKIDQIPFEALSERKKITMTNTVAKFQEEKFSEELMYFSNYSKLLRMVAWILRFANRSKTGLKLPQSLSGEEIFCAEIVLLRLIQKEWAHEQREKYSKSIEFFEKDGIIKVKTRLVLCDDSDDFTMPTVLPDHPITRRLIDYTHKQLKHGGVQTTLSYLRHRFWIPKGRKIIKEVIQTCLPCKRASAKQVITQCPPLPIDRVKQTSAFQVSGVDLAGPIFLRGGNKSWIVLFTCGVYRAVHLELVTSLSTEAFIQSMRRFIARRGRPSVIYSDNGTNFTATARLLQTLDWNTIEERSALMQVKWRFSPPTAPWYGGWWERMVRTVKDLLRKNLGRACLNYEELITVLCDIESTINSRPLTYVSDDPNELRPLTPSDFIQDIQGNETDDVDIFESKFLIRRVRYLQTLREILRKRFKEEYLGNLIRNPQLMSKRDSILPGDIVLVGSDNLKRINWPIAQVLEFLPGKDNIRRVVKLRLSNGHIIRPIQRLYPLELHSNDFKSDGIRDKGNRKEKPTRKRDDKIKTAIDKRDDKIKIGNERSIKTKYGRSIKPPVKLNL